MKLDITLKYLREGERERNRKKGFNANKVIVFSCLGNPFPFSGIPNLYFFVVH